MTSLKPINRRSRPWVRQWDEWFSCILTDEVRESLRQKLDTFCLLTYGEYLPVPPVQNNPAPLQMGPIM